jgi:hypothetical protein
VRSTARLRIGQTHHKRFPRLSEGGEGIGVVVRMDEVEQGTSLRHRDVKQANWL